MTFMTNIQICIFIVKISITVNSRINAIEQIVELDYYWCFPKISTFFHLSLSLWISEISFPKVLIELFIDFSSLSAFSFSFSSIALVLFFCAWIDEFDLSQFLITILSHIRGNLFVKFIYFIYFIIFLLRNIFMQAHWTANQVLWLSFCC